MGIVDSIHFDRFPIQGPHLGRRVRVVFHYDTTRVVRGTVVRDDFADPWITIISLDDRRVVLGTECQYAVVETDDPCR